MGSYPAGSITPAIHSAQSRSVVAYKDFRWLRRHLALRKFLSDLTSIVAPILRNPEPRSATALMAMPRHKLIEQRIELPRRQPLDRLPSRPHFQHVGWAIYGGPLPNAGPMIQVGTLRRLYCGYILRA